MIMVRKIVKTRKDKNNSRMIEFKNFILEEPAHIGVLLINGRTCKYRVS